MSRAAKTQARSHRICDGVLQSPKGATPPVRTIWITEPSSAPRLVTAYPAPERNTT